MHSGDRAGEKGVVLSLGQGLVSRAEVKRDSLTMAVDRLGSWMMGRVTQD